MPYCSTPGDRARSSPMPGWSRLLIVLALATTTAGCGVLAAPCRVTSAVVKMVPLVGHAAALPTDACAAVIDP